MKQDKETKIMYQIDKAQSKEDVLGWVFFQGGKRICLVSF